jgi:hypothetical protein
MFEDATKAKEAFNLLKAMDIAELVTGSDRESFGCM